MFELLFKSRGERHAIRVKRPHVQSMAAGLMLERNLLCKMIPLRKASNKVRLRTYLTFRNKYLRRQRRKHGSLICVYCKAPYLDPNVHNPHKHNRGKATIDHIMPLSKGGAEFDEKNLAVSCSKCNGKKADKIYKPKEQNEK